MRKTTDPLNFPLLLQRRESMLCTWAGMCRTALIWSTYPPSSPGKRAQHLPHPSPFIASASHCQRSSPLPVSRLSDLFRSSLHQTASSQRSLSCPWPSPEPRPSLPLNAQVSAPTLPPLPTRFLPTPHRTHPTFHIPPSARGSFLPLASPLQLSMGFRSSPYRASMFSGGSSTPPLSSMSTKVPTTTRSIPSG